MTMSFKATAALLACGFFFASSWPVGAGVPDTEDEANPYTVIGERNVFHLNPIPIPPPLEPPKAELPEIKLSGFLRIGNSTHVLFASVAKSKKEEPVYYDLTEGEKQGILEVLKIHEQKGEVEILNSGTPFTLTLKNDALEASAGASNKGVAAKPKWSAERRSHGSYDTLPSRAGYRFPVSGENGRPLFPMPTRQTRMMRQ
jgi:hypothetical protein